MCFMFAEVAQVLQGDNLPLGSSLQNFALDSSIYALL